MNLSKKLEPEKVKDYVIKQKIVSAEFLLPIPKEVDNMMFQVPGSKVTSVTLRRVY